MSNKLVIVESPAKAKTIGKILGREFSVKASLGHVRDLPEKRLGVDVARGFKPDYVTVHGRERIVAELRAAAAKADEVFLAPDPDREGEAIAWHLHELLKGAARKAPFHRVRYNEITAAAIREAFGHVGEIDGRKVDAQQARRVLDRLVGYKVSPLLWGRIRGAASAGRVQSVALRLVCEREAAIRAFVPREFWILGARVAKRVDPRDPFPVRLARIGGEKAEVATAADAERIRADLDDRPMRVAAVQRRELSRRAMPPFITSTLQQAGSRLCGFPPSRTMRVAQSLYEGVDFGAGPVGLITYMRTDSVAVARSAQEQARAFVGATFGPAYVPEKPNFFRSRGSAQEAHEAIRPTDVARTPESLEGHLKPDEMKLYRVIWQRFVASQMAPAVIGQRTVEVEAVPPSPEATAYLFRASASEIVFPGYMKAFGWEKAKAPAKDDAKDEEPAAEGGEEEVEALPPLEEGERLDRLEWTGEQKFTQPPPRYSEATLVKALEENGIGRPSTYAQTLSTLVDRRYVEREKRTLRPTGTGEQVNAFLVEHLDALFNVQFTAQMEESLDRIESGEVEWTGMLADFHAKLLGWIDQSRAHTADPARVARLLELAGRVREWQPAVQRGKRTYSDPAFVESLAKQVAEGKTLSDRQVAALQRLAARYRAQVPEIEAEAEALGVPADAGPHAGQPQDPATLRKLQLLEPVAFDPPRKVGKRTFDDRDFYGSLRRQADGGRHLSAAQVKYLDRLLLKYAGQIEGFPALAQELGLNRPEPEPVDAGTAAECAGMIGRLREVREWREPVTRGRRTWDDRKFFGSLAEQFERRGSLSPRQVAALRKMVHRYTTPHGPAPAAAGAPGAPPAP